MRRVESPFLIEPDLATGCGCGWGESSGAQRTHTQSAGLKTHTRPSTGAGGGASRRSIPRAAIDRGQGRQPAGRKGKATTILADDEQQHESRAPSRTIRAKHNNKKERKNKAPPKVTSIFVLLPFFGSVCSWDLYRRARKSFLLVGSEWKKCRSSRTPLSISRYSSARLFLPELARLPIRVCRPSVPSTNTRQQGDATPPAAPVPVADAVCPPAASYAPTSPLACFTPMYV